MAADITDGDTGELPAGWEQQYTPGGRAYFMDHNTHNTTFIDPRSMTAIDATTAGTGRLSAGWEMRPSKINPGRMYFVDHMISRP